MRRETPSRAMEVTSIEDLTDDLLVQILIRLTSSSSKSILPFKCVSKRWFSLISDPSFAARFNTLPKPFTLFFYFHDPDIFYWNEKSHLLFLPKTPEFESDPPLLFLKSLPCYNVAGNKPFPPVYVVGTHSDLLLCCHSMFRETLYYLCNHVSKQRVALPPAPQAHHSPCVAFLCDSQSDQTRFKVVRLERTSETCMRLEIFSSETWEWSVWGQSCPRGFWPDCIGIPMTCCVGTVLYVFGNCKKILAFDLFKSATGDDNNNSNKKMSYKVSAIDMPFARDQWVLEPLAERVWELGPRLAWKGRLCYQIMHSSACYESQYIDMVARIEDGEKENTWKWMSVQKIYFHEMVAEGDLDVGALKQLKEGAIWLNSVDISAYWLRAFSVLGFDPNDEGIMYLKVHPENLVKYNIRTRNLTLVCKLPDTFLCDFSYKVFTLVKPWCPTPLPKRQSWL